MALVLDRNEVLDVYSEARSRRWTIPTFNAENPTTVEAILRAVLDHGETIGAPDLPIIVGITNNYESRAQSTYYTHTRKWDIGLRMFLDDLAALTSRDSPFARLRVMVHLDHTQWDKDHELLEWDMKPFSSIMYDASTLPFEINIRKTAEFVRAQKEKIVIEGACDEITEASGGEAIHLTTPDEAERYFRETGVDIVVANLGTEHRASVSSLKYESDLAREISRRIGTVLCLHGVSSLSEKEISHAFEDGICKLNIWTALERDSTPTLFEEMVRNAARQVGPDKAREMAEAGILGGRADLESQRSIEFFTGTYRRGIIFHRMEEIVRKYLALLYV